MIDKEYKGLLAMESKIAYAYGMLLAISERKDVPEDLRKNCKLAFDGYQDFLKEYIFLPLEGEKQ